MARLREFDPERALDTAMHLFWRKGYAETSVRDLVEHTGVAHAGIYSAFGDKRRLYLAALAHYDATQGAQLMGALEQPQSARAEIEGFFASLVARVRAKQFGDGCLMCNTAVEFGNDDDEITAMSRGNIRRMKSAFKRALVRARARGEVRADLDLAAAASLLTTVFHGVAVLARAKAGPKPIEETVRVALTALD